MLSIISNFRSVYNIAYFNENFHKEWINYHLASGNTEVSSK